MSKINTPDILVMVSDSIKQHHSEGRLVSGVVQVFADREITKRTDLLVKGVELFTVAQKGYDDINKPDTKFVQVNGESLELTTPKRTQEIQAAKKRLDKIAEAFSQAVNDANFGSLDKIVKNGGNVPASDNNEAN